MGELSGVNIIPPISGGSSGRYLEQVMALCLHEVDSFEDIYADDVVITSVTAIAGNSNDGKVTTTRFANAMWVRRYTGTSTQTVDFILNNRYPTVFGSSYRGRGIAYVAMSFDWGDGKTFQGPPIMTFVTKGKKCYDPRLDTSPGANPTNASYIAWTSNPALCWADYLMADYGGSVPASSINWASVVTAADVCDVDVAIPGATTQNRYTFNARIVLPVDPDWRENAKIFVDAMLGRMVRRDGKWFVYAGAWEAASYTIEKVDWLSIDRIKTVAPRDGGRWNTVRCWYVDASRNWQRVECFPRRNATYKSADGAEEIALEMEQPGCDNEYEAQRKAELLLRQSRNQIALSGRLPPRFRKMATGEVVAINFADLGWVSKLMRIRTMNLNPDGSVDVGIAEEQSADWDDLLAAEYNAPSSSAVPGTNPTTPDVPTLSIVNTINGTITFSLATPVVKPIGTAYQIIASAVSTDASVGSVVYDGQSQQISLPMPALPLFYFSRAYVNTYFSAYSPNTLGLASQAYFSTVTQVNCTATQVFSGAGALHVGEIARMDFAPNSANAVVSVTAGYRQGLGNINGFQNILIRFVTGVTSVYDNVGKIPVNGSPTTMQPVTQTGVFSYTAGNSSYVALLWDVASGANSFTLDQVTMRTEFIRL